MIVGIVARFYYKILTIDKIYWIGCRAFCSNSVYVIVGWSFFVSIIAKNNLYRVSNDTFSAGMYLSMKLTFSKYMA